MVDKYSRDDVIQALRAQSTTLTCVKQGWQPLAPQARGGRQPVAELPLAVKTSVLQETVPGLRARGAHDETESESDSERGSDDCASADENEKGEEAAGNAKVVQVIFLLSSLSLCFHAAVLLKDGNYGRVCAPRRAVPEPHWKVPKQHPLEGKANHVPFSYCLLLGPG